MSLTSDIVHSLSSQSPKPKHATGNKDDSSSTEQQVQQTTLNTEELKSQQKKLADDINRLESQLNQQRSAHLKSE
jgi:uncharacterized protein YoxC